MNPGSAIYDTMDPMSCGSGPSSMDPQNASAYVSCLKYRIPPPPCGFQEKEGAPRKEGASECDQVALKEEGHPGPRDLKA